MTQGRTVNRSFAVQLRRVCLDGEKAVLYPGRILRPNLLANPSNELVFLDHLGWLLPLALRKHHNSTTLTSALQRSLKRPGTMPKPTVLHKPAQDDDLGADAVGGFGEGVPFIREEDILYGHAAPLDLPLQRIHDRRERLLVDDQRERHILPDMPPATGLYRNEAERDDRPRSLGRPKRPGSRSCSSSCWSTIQNVWG